MQLLGYDTKMIRTEDISIYTQGDTIAGKKASDLKERVRIVNETENGILLSIHQQVHMKVTLKIFYVRKRNVVMMI